MRQRRDRSGGSGPKTVVCSICGNTVPKGSTLEISSLQDGRPGRACKIHPEVLAMQAAKGEEARERRRKIAADSAPHRQAVPETAPRRAYVPRDMREAGEQCQNW